MNYTVDYFIKKFEAIPKNQWTTAMFVNTKDGSKCAGGHCGLSPSQNCTEEAIALAKLLEPLKKTLINGNPGYDDVIFDNITTINDGQAKEYSQPTPKQRILAALNDVKKMQQPVIKERIVYVSVPTSILESCPHPTN